MLNLLFSVVVLFNGCGRWVVLHLPFARPLEEAYDRHAWPDS